MRSNGYKLYRIWSLDVRCAYFIQPVCYRQMWRPWDRKFFYEMVPFIILCKIEYRYIYCYNNDDDNFIVIYVLSPSAIL